MITTEQARGDSQGLELNDYLKHAQHGEWLLSKLAPAPVACSALVKAWQATRAPWGGITLAGRAQRPYEPSKGYAVAVSRGDTISIPADADRGKFNDAYATAVRRFAYAPCLGIFRDDDLGVIEFDAVVIVDGEDDAKDVATACESLGGAYDFATGNGVWPYHVA